MDVLIKMKDDNKATMKVVHDDDSKNTNHHTVVEPKQKMEPVWSDCGSSYPAFCRLRLKRKYYQSDEHDDEDEDENEDEDEGSSSYLSENGHEEVYDDFYKPARRNANAKRSKIAQRNEINKKMRALRELIPNCNKIDKVSMLDEAIEYMKALQLQAQIMSMGCMSQMMLHVRMQQMLAAHLPRFSPWIPEMGMGMRTDTGVNYNQTHFPTSLALNQETGFPMVGNLGQGLKMTLPSPHFVPFPGGSYAQSVPLGNVYEATHRS